MPTAGTDSRASSDRIEGLLEDWFEKWQMAAALAHVDNCDVGVVKAPARKDLLELNEAVLEVIELARVKLLDLGVLLQTELAQDLPLIQGDRVQLQQVMMNLIVNAVEAMSEMSDGRRELLISTRIEAGDLTVAVRDSGPGFSDNIFDKVFEAFHTTKPTGLGMGLSISRSIVEAHGGQLWASANFAKGAAVQFTLPVLAD